MDNATSEPGADERAKAKFKEKLDVIPHRALSLDGDGDHEVHRPDITLWASLDDDVAHVTMAIASLWGQPIRFVDFTPEEARHFAKLLSDTADAVDLAKKE